MFIRIFKHKIWLYLTGVSGFALLQALSLYPLVNFPFSILLFDSLIYCLLCALISIPFLSVLKFGKIELLIFPLRIFNFAILAIITLGMTLGIAFLLERWIFHENMKSVFFTLLPLRALFSILTYIFIIIFVFREKEKNEVFQRPTTPPIDKDLLPLESDIKTLDRFAVKSGTKIHVVLVSEIICLLADGDYVQVITAQGKFLKEQTMKYFESNLSDNQFVRVHRSCIVNVEAISRIELYEKQNQQLMLKNGHKVKVSQNGYKMLREKLKL
jgi:disulfide bond formation protein DsbB